MSPWYFLMSIKDTHQISDYYFFCNDKEALPVDACFQYWTKKSKNDGSDREESRMIPRFQTDFDELENARNRWYLIFAEPLSN